MENRPMDMVEGEEAEGEMERVTWKLTIPYVKHTASGDLLCDSGNSNGGSATG